MSVKYPHLLSIVQIISLVFVNVILKIDVFLNHITV